jgi:hypothetical protein
MMVSSSISAKVSLYGNTIDSSNNRLVKFLNRDLQAFPGGDAAILILTTIATTLAYVGAMTALINFMAADFTYLTTRVPNFDFQIINGEETGNASFLVFSVLRDMSFQLFIFVLVLFAVLLILKQAQLASNETMKKMLQGAVFGVIILLIFPYIWDPISDTAEKSALSLMNPLYTHDENNPCPERDGNRRDMLFFQHMTTIAEHSEAIGLTPDPDSICRPDLLPNYLFAKALFGADQALEFTGDAETEWWDIGSKIEAQLAVFSDSVMSVLFVGLTKTAMLFFLTSMAVFVSDMRFLLLDVIAISLPLLLVLRCIPFLGIDKMSNTLTEIFIPLLFAPILAALIMLAGATDLVAQEERIITISSPDDINSIMPDRFLFSLHAMATLTLVIISPVMFVPMLGSVSSMMAKMTMTGIMSGIMGTAGMMKGVAGGAMSGFSGMKAGGGLSTMGAVKSMFTNPGAMGSVIGGAATGARGAMGAAFSNDMVTSGRIIPGGSGMGRLFSGGNGGEDNAYHNAYEKSSGGIRDELEQQDISDEVSADIMSGGGYTGDTGNTTAEAKQSTMDQFSGKGNSSKGGSSTRTQSGSSKA